MVARWEKEQLFKESFECNKGKEKFILHDGPPYANGHIHLGHAYNKILKDIVTKSHRMIGKHVPVTPGWDCHGLPIELKVTQENPGLIAQRFKKSMSCLCATNGLMCNGKSLNGLGVLMDWDNPYLTMDFAYEATILHAFGNLLRKGTLNVKIKQCLGAFMSNGLATAEIEYQDRKDPSIYVLFPLITETIKHYFLTLTN